MPVARQVCHGRLPPAARIRRQRAATRCCRRTPDQQHRPRPVLGRGRGLAALRRALAGARGWPWRAAGRRYSGAGGGCGCDEGNRESDAEYPAAAGPAGDSQCQPAAPHPPGWPVHDFHATRPVPLPGAVGAVRAVGGRGGQRRTRRRRRRGQSMILPPAMSSVAPVIQADASEARKSVAAATSSGWPRRPSGELGAEGGRARRRHPGAHLVVLGRRWRDTVDPDAVRCQLGGQVPGQRDHPGLRRRVGGGRPGGLTGCRRRHRDDRAVTAPRHGGEH